jgi:hypothetical protein
LLANVNREDASTPIAYFGIAVVETGQSRRNLMRVFAATLVLFAVYFPAVIYSAHSYKDPPDGGLRPLSLMSVAADGSCASIVWLPKETTKVAIYKDGVRVGYATKVYDDPGRLELATRGFTWKMIEFFDCKNGKPTQSFHALGIVAGL